MAGPNTTFAWSLTSNWGGFTFAQADTLKKEYGSATGGPKVQPGEPAEPSGLAALVALDPKTFHEVFSVVGGSRGTISDAGSLTLVNAKGLLNVDLGAVRSNRPAKETSNQHTKGHFVKYQYL